MELAVRENSLSNKSLRPPYFILNFLSHDGQLFLEATEFAFSGGDVRRCSRGTNSVLPNVGTFRWNQAVRALCILALRYSIYRESDRAEDRSLAGGAGSLAASLDYSIAKNTAWLSEVFGSDANGTLVVRKLITRQNPERKRPGPVVVAFTKKLLDMAFYVNGEEVDSNKDLHEILTLLEPSPDSTSPVDGVGCEIGKSEGQSVLQTLNGHMYAELAEYVQIVIRNTFNPYISVAASEVWSSADAILALVRIPEAQEHLRAGLPFILELLRPPSVGGYTVEESNLPSPLVTATCVMALAELRHNTFISDAFRPQIEEFLAGALNLLLDSQAREGWWTIIGAPAFVLEQSENARVWDTAYAALALEHLLRLGNQTLQVEKARARALTWLLEAYDPERGWTNAPSQQFRISAGLNTFAHFVLMYTSRDTSETPSWKPAHAKRHVESLRSPVDWIEELDKNEYRLKGAQGLSLPHPHHINHGAFLFPLIKRLESTQLFSQTPIKLQISLNDMFTQLGRQKAVYLFSQVLQGLHLFSRE
jgi:hypothetical protein